MARHFCFSRLLMRLDRALGLPPPGLAPICLFITYPSIHPSIHTSIHLCISLSIHLPILSTHQPSTHPPYPPINHPPTHFIHLLTIHPPILSTSHQLTTHLPYPPINHPPTHLPPARPSTVPPVVCITRQFRDRRQHSSSFPEKPLLVRGTSSESNKV